MSDKPTWLDRWGKTAGAIGAIVVLAGGLAKGLMDIGAARDGIESAVAFQKDHVGKHASLDAHQIEYDIALKTLASDHQAFKEEMRLFVNPARIEERGAWIGEVKEMKQRIERLNQRVLELERERRSR